MYCYGGRHGNDTDRFRRTLRGLVGKRLTEKGQGVKKIERIARDLGPMRRVVEYHVSASKLSLVPRPVAGSQCPRSGVGIGVYGSHYLPFNPP